MNALAPLTPTAFIPNQRKRKNTTAQINAWTPLSIEGMRRCTRQPYRPRCKHFGRGKPDMRACARVYIDDLWPTHRRRALPNATQGTRAKGAPAVYPG